MSYTHLSQLYARSAQG